jgi:hypothetical protein
MSASKKTEYEGKAESATSPRTSNIDPNEQLSELEKVVDENFANENLRRLGKTSSDKTLNDQIDLNEKQFPLNEISKRQPDYFRRGQSNDESIIFKIHVDETYNQADTKGSLGLISIQFEQTTEELEEQQPRIFIPESKFPETFRILSCFFFLYICVLIFYSNSSNALVKFANHAIS